MNHINKNNSIEKKVCLIIKSLFNNFNYNSIFLVI